jgi:hypothetical protein
LGNAAIKTLDRRRDVLDGKRTEAEEKNVNECLLLVECTQLP